MFTPEINRHGRAALITVTTLLTGLRGKKLVWIGLSAGIGFYIIDALIDVFLFGERTVAAQLLNPDGPELWMRLSILVICVLFGVYADRSVERVRANERFLDSVIDNIPDTIFVKDARTLNFLRLNRAAERLLGFASAELIGRNDYDFFPRQQAEMFVARDLEVLASGIELDIPEEVIQTRNRGRRYLHTRKVPIADGDDNPAYLLGISSDITDEKIARTGLLREKQRAERFLEVSQAIIVALDRRGTITLINRRGCEILGYDKQELVGKNWFTTVIPHSQRKSVVETFKNIVTGAPGPDEYHEHVVHTRDREERVIYWHNAVQTDGRGRVSGILSSGQDITDRKRAEDGLRLSATVFESCSQGIVVIDRDRRAVSVNPAFTAITGYTLEDLRETGPMFLQSGFHDDDFYRQLWQTIDDQGSWKGEIWDRRRDGEAYPTWQTISAIRDEKGVISSYVSVFSDITPIKQSQANLDFLAHHDPMTGLPNRLMFNDRLEHAFKRHIRNHNKLVLYFLDLDGFKQINDSLGHAAGDQLLQTVARRLQPIFREEDTIARYGGDEFVVLLESAQSRTALERIAGKIIEEISRPVNLDGREIRVATSVGIGILPGDGSDAQSLLRCADRAMYEAKAAGRNQFRFFRSA
jgi:diguanylate cyclase (GGDEF)-like protein/PAS domain S-box-containing protein